MNGGPIATLRDGQKFSTLDRSHAYQQLELDEETQELLTLNTHRRLYHPTTGAQCNRNFSTRDGSEVEGYSLLQGTHG